MSTKQFLLGSVVLTLSAGTGSGEPRVPAEGFAVRIDRVDGTATRGMLIAIEGDSLDLRLEGRTTRIPASSVAALSFVAEADFWRDRERVSASATTILLSDGAGITAHSLRLRPGSLQLEYRTSGTTRSIAAQQLRRVYLNPSAIDFQKRQAEPVRRAAGNVEPERLRRVAAAAAGLRARLEATAHRNDPFEQNAILALSGLEQSTRAVADLMAGRLSSATAFRAIEAMASSSHRADAALDSLHAYESVRAEWARIRDTELHDALERARTAAPTWR